MIERRKYPRFKILCSIILASRNERVPIHCVGYDISQGGIGLVSMKPLIVEQEYILNIRNIENQFFGRLVFEGKLDGKTNVLKYGVEFNTVLSALQLEKILKEVGSVAFRKDEPAFS